MGELSAGLPKVTRRFVAEMLFGIQARGSVRLTEVGRALGEKISLKKTEERLSRQLGRWDLERLTLLEAEGKVGYRHGEKGAELETMDYLEFIARVTSHIPDKGQVTVRYYGLYANAHRGKVRKASLAPSPLRIVEEDLRRLPAKGWAAMIRKVYEVDPMDHPVEYFS